MANQNTVLSNIDRAEDFSVGPLPAQWLRSIGWVERGMQPHSIAAIEALGRGDYDARGPHARLKISIVKSRCTG